MESSTAEFLIAVDAFARTPTSSLSCLIWIVTVMVSPPSNFCGHAPPHWPVAEHGTGWRFYNGMSTYLVGIGSLLGAGLRCLFRSWPCR